MSRNKYVGISNHLKQKVNYKLQANKIVLQIEKVMSLNYHHHLARCLLKDLKSRATWKHTNHICYIIWLPHSQIVPQKLHNQSTVLVWIFFQLIQFCNSIIKCLQRTLTTVVIQILSSPSLPCCKLSRHHSLFHRRTQNNWEPIQDGWDAWVAVNSWINQMPFHMHLQHSLQHLHQEQQQSPQLQQGQDILTISLRPSTDFGQITVIIRLHFLVKYLSFCKLVVSCT